MSKTKNTEEVNGHKLEKFFGLWDIDDEEMASINKKILDARRLYKIHMI
jgi:hypothetical protein